MEIPVYIITGFLESGKTTFIKNTLEDPNFASGEKTILLLCEEGMEEYDTEALEKNNIFVIPVENEEDLSPAFLKKCQSDYRPERVMIEFNGTWSMSGFIERGMPRGWELAQMITMADAGTFEVYMSNMRQMMAEQINFTELVIFNRCTAETKRNTFRKAVRALNRRAQVL
ncbi:MAG: hypothetical protein IJ427_00810, partial [Lachnospiraceae bacterium]|nr:hypothetical protein [Lachnospiraceae bacterium]